jgi:hypothetical protein
MSVPPRGEYYHAVGFLEFLEFLGFLAFLEFVGSGFLRSLG